MCVCVSACSSHNSLLIYLLVYLEAEVLNTWYDCPKGSVWSKNSDFGLSKVHTPDRCLFVYPILTGQHNHKVRGQEKSGVDIGGTAMMKQFVTKKLLVKNEEGLFQGQKK